MPLRAAFANGVVAAIPHLNNTVVEDVRYITDSQDRIPKPTSLCPSPEGGASSLRTPHSVVRCNGGGSNVDRSWGTWPAWCSGASSSSPPSTFSGGAASGEEVGTSSFSPLSAWEPFQRAQTQEQCLKFRWVSAGGAFAAFIISVSYER